MVSRRSVKRGEIWFVKLDPTVGSEIRKTRPCVIVSPAEIHDHLRTAIIAPLTSKGFSAPYRISIRHGGRDRIILLDQIRAIDKGRLTKRVGVLPPATVSAVLSLIAELFAEY
ncbi:MAG TPA: type II toxin-antitoxin system PemK/MazF family toxin [Terracidiphilus sp.]|nr:type II toxin-antitoxin system PemK/MazF family toxin [Terracidiphilus sp.]